VKILVIDDEEMIRDLVQKILTRAGFAVVTAESGQSGINIFADNLHHIGLVLLDLTMDGMSGVDTLRRIRALSPDVPCLISSGQAPAPDEIPEQLKANVYFLQKPYRANQLAAMVSEIITRRGRRVVPDTGP